MSTQTFLGHFVSILHHTCSGVSATGPHWLDHEQFGRFYSGPEPTQDCWALPIREVRALKTFQTCKQYNIIQPCLTQNLLLWNQNTVILPRFMFGLSPHVLTFKWSEHDSQHRNLGQLDDSLHYVAPIQLWFRDVDFLSLTSTNDNAWWIIKSTVARGKQNPTDRFFSCDQSLRLTIPEGQRVVV